MSLTNTTRRVLRGRMSAAASIAATRVRARAQAELVLVQPASATHS